jgi:ATP-dependent RNA helicase DDX46/PRP5
MSRAAAQRLGRRAAAWGARGLAAGAPPPPPPPPPGPPPPPPGPDECCGRGCTSCVWTVHWEVLREHDAAAAAAEGRPPLEDHFAAMERRLAGGAAPPPPGAPPAPARHYEAELEINDFPQHARWKATHRDTLRDVAEATGAAVVTKGRYTRPGAAPPPGERKLYLEIQGATPEAVRAAKAELKKALEESTEKALRRDAPAAGRYSVM